MLAASEYQWYLCMLCRSSWDVPTLHISLAWVQITPAGGYTWISLASLMANPMASGVKWKSHFGMKKPSRLRWAEEWDENRHLCPCCGSAILREFSKLTGWGPGKPHPSPKPFQDWLLHLELAGSANLAPSILALNVWDAPQTPQVAMLKGFSQQCPEQLDHPSFTDAVAGRRVRRRLEKVMLRLQFPNQHEGAGCLNTLQLKQSWLLRTMP